MSLRDGMSIALLLLACSGAMSFALAAQNNPSADKSIGQAADRGDTVEAERRPWDAARDFPPAIITAKDVKYDYPIVYVRVPRPYPKEYYNINHLNQAGLHQTNAPGAELRILFPDGKDELLVGVEPKESITDPMVSFDGQGGDAGLYENSDIWGVRMLVLEPVSDVVWQKRHHFALGSNAEERIRILGEFPVRKFPARSSRLQPASGDTSEQLLDPDGNPDTSFLAKIPADVAWTFQTIDHRGMTLNMAQTWHQVRPGELRNNCGGCHAHSQQPTDFALTAAANDDYKIWDLAGETPLFTTKAADTSGRKWDKHDSTGVRIAKTGVYDVEFYRDIKPLLERSCVACHSRELEKPAGRLALDDDRSITKQGLVPWAENVRVPEGLPHTYWRLAQYSWAFQSRRSPLIWKIYGERLDGFNNDDVESPALDYHDEQSVLNWCHHSKRFQYDVDYTGTAMPPPKAIEATLAVPDGQMVKVPPLTDEEKLIFVRWVDIGCPIDRDYDPAKPLEHGRGWLLDEGRPTLALSLPLAGENSEPLSRILIGMHDYASGLDLDTFRVTADIAIDGAPAGENLAAKFQPTGEGIWALQLAKPIDRLNRATLNVSIQDRQGNITRIERNFSVK